MAIAFDWDIKPQTNEQTNKILEVLSCYKVKNIRSYYLPTSQENK